VCVRPATCITEREIDLYMMNVILIEGVVKGYHECEFTVTTGESFILENPGPAFWVQQRD
jgi:hypothetical protein